ncbi:DNA gyrase subunit A [Phycisphaerales bacterium]|nr:DNA gyrase subunit A [Phycisphaerales bacterium]
MAEDESGMHRSPDPEGGGASGIPGDQPSRVVEQDVQRELKDSYLTYAMSTIMDRALPDVRDGLKPSQRRILWAMNDLNLRPNRKHVKCAKVVGDTMGNYHPHGDLALYGTLVGMAQPWRVRTQLVNPQGNFGSIEGDPPAAMRYTEARMAVAAADMLADINLDAVDFQANYDDTRREPTVLPGKFPNLLINGGVGIAVGMATSLLPHNPTEVFDTFIRVVEARLAGRARIPVEELMQDVKDAEGNVVRHGIKGPDFPTGGVVAGRRGILEAYASGRGKVALRGMCHVEDLAGGRQQIVINAIPYMLAQNNLVEWIVEAVKEDRVTDVSDVRNESGREAVTRIVIELKKGVDPRTVEKQLYEFTPLQQTVSIINIALVNRQPRTLGLHEMLDAYLEHRHDVIRRRTAYLLREAKKRAHVLEGMILAVCEIDEVIREIRASTTRDEAIERLMTRRFRIAADHKHAARLPAGLLARIRAAEALGGVALTRVQAETIGGMRLIQLVGLEIERLVADYVAVVGEIDQYEVILASPARVLGIIKDELEEMRARYRSARITSIEDTGEDILVEDLIPREDVAVTISHQGYVKRVPLETYRQQGRGGKGIRAGDSKDDDFIEHVFVAGSHDDLLCFTNTGRVFKIKVYEVPEMSRVAVGRAIVNLVELKPGERTCAYLAIKSFEAGSDFLTFVSKGGIVKRTALKAYANVSRAGLIAVGLKEGDTLLDVTLTDGNDDLLLATASGMAIRFNEQDARDMGRAAAGVKGIDLAEGDEVIGVVPIRMNPDAQGDLISADPSICLLTITERGYGKRTAIDEYRVQPESGKMRSQSRGGKGRVDIDTGERNGRSVAALAVNTGDDVVVITRGGQLVRMPTDDIRLCGRGAMGVRVAGLNEGDFVVAAARVPEVEGPQPGAPAPSA